MEILQKEQSAILYKTSYLLLGPVVYGFYRGYYLHIIFPLAGCLSSINHWRDPKFDWKRSIDVTTVRVAIIGHTLMTYNMEYTREYYSILCLSFILYLLGWYYYYKNQYWNSTYIHVAYHLLNNLAMIILYSKNSITR